MNKETTDYEAHTEDIKSKPREFWIDESNINTSLEDDETVALVRVAPETHWRDYDGLRVIEYSAYVQLQIRIKQLEKELSDLRFIYEKVVK